jgi:RNA polymerase sigma-70 factor (ECF subfamily)
MLDPGELARILDDVAGGNPDAFGRVVRAYSLPLRSYLARLVHNLSDVDDLAQDVLLAAYRNLGAFRREENFGVWLRGIARHKLYDHFRRTTAQNRAFYGFREEVAHLVETDLEQAAAADRAEAIEALLRCVAHLPEKMRRVVRAGLDGDRPAVLAEALATSVGAIYTLHYRANELLRACVQKELADG